MKSRREFRIGDQLPRCPLRVKTGCLSQPIVESASGGKADEIGDKADIAYLIMKFHGVKARAYTTRLKLCLPGPR